MLQLISQELNREYLRRSEALRMGHQSANPEMKTPAKKAFFMSPATSIQGISPVLSVQLLDKVKKVDSKPRKDFFGRILHDGDASGQKKSTRGD